MTSDASDGAAAGAVGVADRAPAGGGFADQVVAWQRSHGRHALPWQASRDPYRVWLSEVMLQQTQVAVVVEYYGRFLQHFPTVQALAAAPLADVLALWSGLGYYSRARNLHRCAQAVVDLHGGVFPQTTVGLQQLPGIGRSTAAAIAAFCFGERAAILDGNVKRVLCRVFGFGADLAQACNQRALWTLAEDVLPDVSDIGRYTQGMMDLGATVCTLRRPACLLCPVRTDCVALREGRVADYPHKSRKTRRGMRDAIWLWLWHEDRFWLTERPASGIWAQLLSLPEFAAQTDLDAASARWPGRATVLPPFVHALTHLDWTLRPLRWTLPAALSADALAEITAALGPGRWATAEQALQSGLPTPLRRLIESSAAAAADHVESG